jgi:hypothetical protein
MPGPATRPGRPRPGAGAGPGGRASTPGARPAGGPDFAGDPALLPEAAWEAGTPTLSRRHHDAPNPSRGMLPVLSPAAVTVQTLILMISQQQSP